MKSNPKVRNSIAHNEHVGATPIHYSVFRSVNDLKSFDACTATWPELVGLIRDPKTHRSKAAAPLIKLATFGNRGNDKGSLRHDGNIDQVFGIEGDYDAELVTPAAAAACLRAAGVRAIVYTSASHGVVALPKSQGGPRWRVLAPLSGPVAPELRAELVSILNGALGGILAGESWTLSQTFYFGKVAGVEYEVHEVDGEPLDLHAALGEIDPIGPSVAVREAVKLSKPRSGSDADQEEVAHLVDSPWFVGYRDDGGLDVRCPRGAMHGTDSGPSSTTYFPSGVGNRAAGFECRHTSCGKPNTTEFLAATGLDKIMARRTVAEFVAVVPAPGEPLAHPTVERKRSGKIAAERNGLRAILARPDLCGMNLRFDTFANQIMWSPYGEPDGWRPFKETDRTAMCLNLEQGMTGFERIPDQLAREMVRYAAECQQFDSAQHWLGGLAWDGVPRVHSFIHTYLRGADAPYTHAVSAYLMTALAGRVLEPGIKADMVPVFCGPQGAGKSSVVAALAPSPSQFLELDFAKNDDNLLREMCGRLVIELGELRGMRTREQADLKQFISRRSDTWVPKFIEDAREYRRRSVFVGTTNSPEFLSDDTGHRRWLPVMVEGHGTPQAIGEAAAAVTAVRDQLWAEGAAMFRAAGIAWQEAERLAKPEHSRFEAGEPWGQAIAHWVVGDDMDGPRDAAPFTTEQVLVGAIGVELKHIGDIHRKRVASVLRRMGYADRRAMLNGFRSTFWSRPT